MIRVTGNCGHNRFILTGWSVVFRLSTWLKTIYYTRSIFPWVRSVVFIPPCTRVNGVLESTQVVFGWRWGYILDPSPVQCNWRDNLHQQAIPLDCLACLGFLWRQISNTLCVFQSHSQHNLPSMKALPVGSVLRCLRHSLSKGKRFEISRRDHQGFLLSIYWALQSPFSLHYKLICKLHCFEHKDLRLHHLHIEEVGT